MALYNVPPVILLPSPAPMGHPDRPTLGELPPTDYSSRSPLRLLSSRWQHAAVLAIVAVLSLALLRLCRLPFPLFQAYHKRPASRSDKQSLSPLLKLPRELRERVYTYLVAETGPVTFEPTVRRPIGPTRLDKVGEDKVSETEDLKAIATSHVDRNILSTGLMSRRRAERRPEGGEGGRILGRTTEGAAPFSTTRHARFPGDSRSRPTSVSSRPFHHLHDFDFFKRLFTRQPPKRDGVSGLLLANRQIHDEYASVLCRDAKLCFRFSTDGEKGHDDPCDVWPSFTLGYLNCAEKSGLDGGEEGRSHQSATTFATPPAAPTMANKIRQLEVTIELKSTPDQNNVLRPSGPSEDQSAIFHRSVEFISRFPNLKELHIRVVVFGSVVVNPVRRWQAFADLFQPLFEGPRTTISFALADWSVPMNVLARPVVGREAGRDRIVGGDDPDADHDRVGGTEVKRAPWFWSCGKGHVIHEDLPHRHSVVYFYSSLCRPCRECS